MISPAEIENRCLGKTLVEATKLLNQLGFSVRQVRNHVVFHHELLDEKRVNVVVENGVVKSWQIG